MLTLATRQKQPGSIAIDAQQVYWANHGLKRPTYFQDGSVVRMPRDGGKKRFTIAKAQTLASSLVVDDAWIYWTTAIDFDEPHALGALRKRRKAGGKIVELASWHWYEDALLALDATHVYWLSSLRPAIFRARKEGGEPEQLMAGEQGAAIFPDSLVVDDRCVYWTVRGSQRAGGAVFKMAK